VVGDKARDCDDPPPGGGVENIAQPPKIRDPIRRQTKPAEPVEELAAGAPDQQALLSLEEQPPDRVLFVAVGAPVLLYRKI
jgi:hypothetical protein